MNTKVLFKSIGVLFSLVFSFSACRRGDDDFINRAWYQLQQSEQIAIPPAIDLPPNLPNGNSRVASFYAEGVQKYKAQPKAGNPAELEWVFLAPEADLYDASGKKVGTHGAGPYWQLSPADSLFGQAFSPARNFASSDASSIDWLLLMAKPGKNPTGRFADVAYIQRIATRGGKAPQKAPQSAAETVAVPYSAVYRFSKKN